MNPFVQQIKNLGPARLAAMAGVAVGLIAVGDAIGPEAIMVSGADTFGPPSNGASAGLVGRTVADVERDLIIDTLKHTLGNRTHAAKILGISIRTLRNKLNAYVHDGLSVPAPGASETA